MNEARNLGNSDDDSPEWSAYEHQVIAELQERGDLDDESFRTANQDAEQKMFSLFQDAAQGLAFLYKVASDSDNPALWSAFQTAAGAFTAHHKACVDYLRLCAQHGFDCGSRRRTRDVLAYIRRKRTWRRDDLVALLAGKSPPPKSAHYRACSRSRTAEQRPRARLQMPQLSTSAPAHHEPDLTTFREALGIAGSPTTLHRRRLASSTPGAAAVGAGGACFGATSHQQNELQSFLVEEFLRNNKRPAPSPSPPGDVTMDSPQHKRFKFV